MSTYQSPAFASSTSSAFAAAISLGTLSFASHNIKPAKLTLTPHHLFYLLSRFEENCISIGPMNVRLENIHAEASPANYVSFLSQSQRSKGRSDRDSIHSVSSVRSVMSSMSILWSNFGLSSSNSGGKTEKARAQQILDLKYLYSAFTKIPCLRLSPDRKSPLIRGFEEFPFDTAVPLLSFKNLSALEISDVDFRQFYGWDKLAEQLRSLAIKRGDVEDPTDLLTGIVLDDMERRRRRSSKAHNSPLLTAPFNPPARQIEVPRQSSTPSSPLADEICSHSSSPHYNALAHGSFNGPVSLQRPRTKSPSPSRPSSSKQEVSYRHVRNSATKIKRSGSCSSNSSTNSSRHHRTGSSSNILTLSILPASKWRFLRHLGLADNSLTSIGSTCFAPLANTLYSLDLSSNLFAEIPDTLATLTALRALNLSNCMIESLHSLARNPLPAITALNLRANRLVSIAGVERLLPLERLDLRENKISDPTETARLTGLPNIRELWIMGNPMVKSHSNYRIMIFNLFRSTPGFIDDIIIDALGPGYSERRQLKDRVAEPENVPVIKPMPTDQEVESHSRAGTIAKMHGVFSEHDKAIQQQRPVPLTVQSEVSAGSNRRRKGIRRRIVDLSTDESPQSPHRENFIHMPQDKTPAALEQGLEDEFGQRDQQTSPAFSRGNIDLLSSGKPKFGCSSSPLIHDPLRSSKQEQSVISDVQSLSLNGEAYRQKVETLKGEVGSNWLSVLREEGWTEHRKPKPTDSDFGHLKIRRPELSTLQPTSQKIVSSSRTIG